LKQSDAFPKDPKELTKKRVNGFNWERIQVLEYAVHSHTQALQTDRRKKNNIKKKTTVNCRMLIEQQNNPHHLLSHV